MSASVNNVRCSESSAHRHNTYDFMRSDPPFEDSQEGTFHCRELHLVGSRTAVVLSILSHDGEKDQSESPTCAVASGP